MPGAIKNPQAARRQLLARILASREFAHAHTLKRILQFICEKSESGTPPKEYEIAVHAMNRAASFDPRVDPIVRVSVASIRERLACYFMGEGRDEPILLSVPKGRYTALFSERQEARQGRAAWHPGALSLFWEEYFATQAITVILYTEPLFFRDGEGRYYRDWYVNNPAESGSFLRKIARGGLGRVNPCYHYLSTGEVHCMLSVSRLFHEAGVRVETRNCRTSSWGSLQDANLVLLGSPRTNSFLMSLQESYPYFVAADRIENREPAPGEEKLYLPRRFRSGELDRTTEYAVITRRPGLAAGTSITLIASNHGRAIEAAGHYLTMEGKVAGILRRLTAAAAHTLPRHFQLLMSVDMIELDDEVVGVECVGHRLLGEAGPALPMD